MLKSTSSVSFDFQMFCGCDILGISVASFGSLFRETDLDQVCEGDTYPLPRSVVLEHVGYCLLSSM